MKKVQYIPYIFLWKTIKINANFRDFRIFDCFRINSFLWPCQAISILMCFFFLVSVQCRLMSSSQRVHRCSLQEVNHGKTCGYNLLPASTRPYSNLKQRWVFVHRRVQWVRICLLGRMFVICSACGKRNGKLRRSTKHFSPQNWHFATVEECAWNCVNWRYSSWMSFHTTLWSLPKSCIHYKYFKHH